MTERREINRHHKWRPGQDPHDPRAGDPNWSEPIPIEKLIEADEKSKPQFPLWTPGGGPESSMPCFNCGGKTYIVDSKTVQEILEPMGWSPEEGSEPPTERILALACENCDQVTQMREKYLPRPR